MRWTTALQGRCCHGHTVAPPLSCQPRGTATPPPAMGCYHLTASHGLLLPCHQLWDIVTPLPARPVLFMELLAPTAPTVAEDRCYKVIRSLQEHSRGQMAPPNEAGTSLSCTCHGPSHQEEPGLLQLHVTPPGEKILGKKKCPLVPSASTATQCSSTQPP